MPGAPFAWTKAGLEVEIGLAAPFSPASIEIVGTWDCHQAKAKYRRRAAFPDHAEKFPDRPI
jgi:hypothetical protein